VRDWLTGQGVSGVTVHLSSSLSEKTDGVGNFAFPTLSEGTYAVEFSHPKYQEKTVEVVLFGADKDIVVQFLPKELVEVRVNGSLQSGAVVYDNSTQVAIVVQDWEKMTGCARKSDAGSACKEYNTDLRIVLERSAGGFQQTAQVRAWAEGKYKGGNVNTDTRGGCTSVVPVDIERETVEGSSYIVGGFVSAVTVFDTCCCHHSAYDDNPSCGGNYTYTDPACEEELEPFEDALQLSVEFFLFSESLPTY